MIFKKAFITGLTLLLVCLIISACGQPVKKPRTPTPPQLPTQADNQTPPQASSPEKTTDEADWSTVQTFTDKESKTTTPFHISGTKWRIIWTANVPQSKYAVLDIFVYSQDTPGILIKKISYSQSTSSETVYIDEGGRDYYLKIIAANLTNWTITVEDYAIQELTYPVQITKINYKGTGYFGTMETNRDIVEFDEYVEIKNLGDSPQNISGWVLKNLTKGEPSFVFPTFKPCSCEWYNSMSECIKKCYPPGPCIIEPRKSIRVYTGEAHYESGGFCFYYPPGNIWNNEIPDTAVLYNLEGQEVSRKSYIISTKNSVTSDK